MKPLLAFLIIFFVHSALASWYPPDYPSSTSCKQNGAVKVCLINHHSQKPYLEISYSGTQLIESGNEINAYIRVNGKDAFFKMNKIQNSFQVKVNHYRNVHMCVRYLSYPRGGMPYCPNASSGEIRGQVQDWYSENPPQLEMELLGPLAFQNPPVVEVAFFNERGEWDSLNGQNYIFSH